jgi:protein TonB
MPELIGQRTTSNDALAAARSMRGGAKARMRGLAAAQLIVIIGIIALLAIAAWWYLGRSGPAGTGTATAPAASTSATPDAAEIPAPEAGAAELTVDQLYKEARSAMSDNRMVAPAGKNALEYYLRIVAKQPDDTGAKDALRELFPFATAGVEDQINQGNFDEASRIMALLAKADPSNYTLTILRSKLDLKKKQNDRDLAQKAAQDAATAAAAARGAQTPAAADGTAPATADASAAPAAATGTPATAAPAAEAAPKPTEVAKATPPPAPVAPVGESRDVRVLTPPRPSYPPAAVRNRQDGWVEVEFTVGADGSVQNAHVTASEPARVFDREAVSAVQRAKFEPRLENGQAVASTLRRRIEFKLGN